MTVTLPVQVLGIWLAVFVNVRQKSTTFSRYICISLQLTHRYDSGINLTLGKKENNGISQNAEQFNMLLMYEESAGCCWKISIYIQFFQDLTSDEKLLRGQPEKKKKLRKKATEGEKTMRVKAEDDGRAYAK